MSDQLLRDFLQSSLMAGPLLGWAALGILILLIQIFNPNPKLSMGVTLLGVLGLIGCAISNFNTGLNEFIFFGSAVWDPLSQVFNLITGLIVLCIVLMMIPALSAQSKVFEDAKAQIPEFLVCMLFSSFGVGVLASATDLTALFLGLETLSIGLYALCGFFRTDLRSTESAFKYLLIGAFSTAIFLYGVAFIYGASGSTAYRDIAVQLTQAPGSLLWFGTVFLVAGFAFKLAFVPFHLYTPDVYEGAPTPVTAFMATIIKVGAAAAAIRVFWGFLAAYSDLWVPLWMSLCVVSILFGNLGALQQKTLKRLLAFSSISHAGFIGLALIVAAPVTTGLVSKGDLFPLLAYLVVYSAMSIGSFAVVSFLESRGTPFLLEDLKGMGQEKVGISILFAIFLLGLAGIPPFAGFMIKFWVLQGLVQGGHWLPSIVAVVGSIIGAAYYLRLLIYIFVSPERGRVLNWSPASDRLVTLRLVIWVTAILTLIGGLRPNLYADWILSTLALK